MQRGLFTGILFGVAMVIFALQNPVTVPVKILWMKFSDVPLAAILVVSALIGVTVTAVFSFIDKQKLKSRIRRLQSKIKENEGNSSDNTLVQEYEDPNSELGPTVEGEPGNKFFDY